MATKNENAEFLTEQTKSKVTTFVEADEAYKKKLDEIKQKLGTDLEELDALRDERNVRLDDAKHCLRADAERTTKARSIKYGPFTISKKWSEWFIPETFEAIAKQHGLFDSAKDAGVVQIVTTVNKDLANAWIKSKGQGTLFDSAKDGKEGTPSVRGPKTVAGLGEELK